MLKNILTVTAILSLSLGAQAALQVSCKTQQGDVSAALDFEGSSVKIQVAKGKTIVHTTQGGAVYNEKWNSIAVDGTDQNTDILKGVKIYFESSRYKNNSASIRPYGPTTQELFPGNEGIVVVGMTCDQDYQTIQNEVVNY